MKAESIISLEDFVKLNNEDRRLFFASTTKAEREAAGIGELKRIKLKPHVMIAEITRLQKKGVTIEIRGFSYYAVTDNALLLNIINKVNKGK